jgi:hypothetical protein
MFTLIESKEEITKVQGKLESAIRRDFKQRAIKNIGYFVNFGLYNIVVRVELKLLMVLETKLKSSVPI